MYTVHPEAPTRLTATAMKLSRQGHRLTVEQTKSVVNRTIEMATLEYPYS